MRVAKDALIEERLRLYETVLRERGIDPEQVAGIPKADIRPQNSPSESSQNARESTVDIEISESQSTVFTPKLIQGTKFVDNNLWSRLAEEVSER